MQSCTYIARFVFKSVGVFYGKSVRVLFLIYETEIVLVLAVLENSVLPLG